MTHRLRRSTRLLAVSALAGMALAGCDRLGSPIDVISGKPPAPDEFAVVTRKPLQMPGSANLPSPRLGEASPLEPDPATEAAAILFGRPVPTPVAVSASPGERELLRAASAQNARSDIRTVLPEDDARIAAQKPYEAPLLIDLFSGTDDKVDPADVIDPKAEARRIQREGIAIAPIDPNDRPEPEAVETPEVINDRRPNNRLPVEGTGPAFE